VRGFCDQEFSISQKNVGRRNSVEKKMAAFLSNLSLSSVYFAQDNCKLRSQIKKFIDKETTKDIHAETFRTK